LLLKTNLQDQNPERADGQKHAVPDRPLEAGGASEGQGLGSDPLRFASLIAHQLQSPLSVISSALQNVLAEYTGPLLPQQRGVLERAGARCDQAITSVRRMLAIIRAQSAPEFEGPPASLEAVLRQVQSQYAEECAGHDVTLEIEIHEEGMVLKLTEAALAEIVSALVSNAIKYTPDHGRIRISSRAGERAGFVCLSVADSGVGVPEVDRKRVFEPFFRTPAARTSARPGMGLGLAFVKSLVTSAGGDAGVDKADLGGADFLLNMPLARPDEGDKTDRKTAPPMRIVVIGGVTAGPKAVAKIFRLMPEADVTVVDRGTLLSYSGCGLPYYVSGVVRDQKRLISGSAGVVRDSVFFRSVKNLHVMNQTEVLQIDRAAGRVRVRDNVTGRELWIPYDRLLLATGSSPVIPPSLAVKKQNVYTLHGVRDAEGIKMAMAERRARDVVIIGGGLIGLEMTEALVSRGARVTIVEKLPHILPMLDPDLSCLVQAHLETRGVRILTGTKALELLGGGAVSAVLTDHGSCPADMVIIATGVEPNSGLAREAGLALGETGAILVDRAQQTTDPRIYAAGDCAETVHLLTGRPYYFPLGSTAMKQGRVAAVNICGGRDTFPGVMGTCICKVFEFCAARTGFGESEARDLGHDVITVTVAGPDKAHYMPTAALLILKLVVDRKSRQLLGAQATGPGAADKRIDVAAMAISARATVDSLGNADLSYAPPYSPAMDNLITAANVARNKLDGHMQGISAGEAHRRLKEKTDTVLLDVRTPDEHERLRLPKSTLIPLGALRGRLQELPVDRDIIVYCDTGLRSYEGALILRAEGYGKVWVLDGGMAAWPFEKLE